MNKTNLESNLRKEIERSVKKIFAIRKQHYNFVPIKSKVQYSGAVYDEDEVVSMFNTILDGWFVLGKKCKEFEDKLGTFLNAKNPIVVNSGSSANLLALSALMSSQWKNGQRIEKGCEVITPAVTFPTTLNPIIQTNLIPAFVDVDIDTFNINLERLNENVTESTCAIMLPHTLGNPNDMRAILDFAEDNDLYVIEDSCDALGAKYDGKTTGTFGIMGTYSFYPAHHMTMGEGGAVVTNDDVLPMIIRSLRDWGRACVCPVCAVSIDPNYNCPLRFQQKIEQIPEDYDQRYVYLNIGYNLKPVEVQCAMGLAQLRKLPEFIKDRKKNFRILYEEFKKYEDYFILPYSLPKSEPAWYAFPLTIRKGSPFKRKELIEWFNKHNIEVKNIFGGNIVQQPAYSETEFRVRGSLENSKLIMYNSFFIGLYPGIDETKMNFMISVIKNFMDKYK